MASASEWLSRKLGYGFAFDEELPAPEKWILDAKAQVAAVPKFDPWRLIAKNPEAKNLKDRQLPEEVTSIKAYDLTVEDLRYPTDISRAVIHFKKMNSERERLRKLQSQGKISEYDANRLWYKKYNIFSWWRDTLTRGLDNSFGTTPVFNRFWHFWINHFSVNTEMCEGELFGSYYLTIRANLAKNFEDLLFAAVWHPAMQEFLQNSQSVGPHSKAAQWTRENGGSGPTSINENLARELLELYTVTPAAGYTQADVTNAVYILTGWGSYWPDEHSSQYFQVNRHEPGTFNVMGKAYNDPNPEDRLPKLCKDLARHPLTAKHIARKLACHFISDNPPESAIKEIEKVYLKTGGSLVAVHQAVIDEVVNAGPDQRKFLAPELWFWQLHKATRKGFWMDFMGKNPDQGSDQINCRLVELGQLHSNAPQPNGWSDREVDWITPEYFDRRVRYAHMLGFKLFNSPEFQSDPGKVFDPKNYIDRLVSSDSNVIKLVKRAESYPVSVGILFCSEQFMRA